MRRCGFLKGPWIRRVVRSPEGTDERWLAGLRACGRIQRGCLGLVTNGVQLRTRAGSDLRVRPLSLCRLWCAGGADLRTVRRSAHVPDVRRTLIGARIAG